jgi:hypothetical protein
MIRHAGLILLAGVLGIATVKSQAPTTAHAPMPNRLYEGDTMNLRGDGRPERNVKVLKITHFPDGESLADLQDVDTGAKYTVSGKVLVSMAKQATIIPAAKLDKLPLPGVPTVPSEPSTTKVPSPVSKSTKSLEPLSPLTNVANSARGKRKPEPLPLKPDPVKAEPMVTIPAPTRSPVPVVTPPPVPMPMPMPSVPVRTVPVPSVPVPPMVSSDSALVKSPVQQAVALEPVIIVPVPTPPVPGTVEVKPSADYPKQMPAKRSAPEIPELVAEPPGREVVLPARVRLELPKTSRAAEELAKQAIVIERNSRLVPPSWPTPPEEKGLKLDLPKASKDAEALAKQSIVVDRSTKLKPPVWPNSPDVAPAPQKVVPKPEPKREEPKLIPEAKESELPVAQKQEAPLLIPEAKDCDEPIVAKTVTIAEPKQATIPEIPPVIRPEVQVRTILAPELNRAVSKLFDAKPLIVLPTQPSRPGEPVAPAAPIAAIKQQEEFQARRESLAITLGNQRVANTPPTPISMMNVPSSPTISLGDRINHETADDIRDLFNAMRPSVRERAATALSECRYNWRPEIKGILAKAAIRDPAATVRAHCIKLLSNLGYAEAPYIRALEYLAATDEEIVKKAAEGALARLSPSK